MNLMEKLGLIKKELAPCLMHIPADCIVPNPLQPRRVFDNDELHRLAASIRENGIIQPLCVRRRDNPPEISINGQTVRTKQTYELIAGERRWRAAQLAGLKSVPCVLMAATAGDSARMVLAENSYRCDLDYLEQAAAMQNILIVCGVTQAQLAESLGISQPTVANKLRLLKFSEAEKVLLRENRISERVARIFLRVGNPDTRIRLMKNAIEQGCTAEECETAVESYFAGVQKTIRAKRKSAAQKLVGAVSDIRFVINTVDKAINLAAAAGFAVEREETDKGDYVELCIKIPKSRMAS